MFTYLINLGHFGTRRTTVTGSAFDFNADGAIDGPNDFAQFGARFGRTL